MKTKQRSLVLSLLIVAAFSTPPLVFAQGKLEPPGAPAPMFRTLEEVQPRRPIGTNATPGTTNALFKITQPGSYYLTTNITGVAGKHGIFIAVGGVTLDLMGFELVGVSNALSGIAAGSFSISISNVVVRNGTVGNWGGFGIEAFNAENSQYQDLRITGNRGNGIRSGKASTLVNCSARRNTSNGIEVHASVVSGCTAQFNGNDGIQTVEGPNVIKDCSVSYNGGNGITASDACTVTGCGAARNTGSGIYVSQGCTVSACTVSGNADGIFANSSSSIYGCTAVNNDRDGIRVNGDCRVTDNTCVFNGSGGNGDGINVLGTQNRIENNHATDNRDAGIHVSQIENLIMRNSCSGNTTNYVIISGNKVGVIVAAPNSGAISGNTGGAGVGTTDPWANFAY